MARIASEQHDLLVGGRERGPEFDIELAFDGVLHPTTGTTPGSITWPTVLRATFRNLGGKEADGALVTIFVPSTVELGPCGPKGAGASEFLALAPAEDELESGGARTTSRVHSWRIDRLPPRQKECWHGLFMFPGGTSHEVTLRIEHEDANSVLQRYRISVAEDGTIRISDPVVE